MTPPKVSAWTPTEGFDFAPLRTMGAAIAADDYEHCTKDPIFTVQKKEIIAGIDLDFTGDVVWIYDGERVPDEEAAVLEAEYDKTCEVPDGHTRTGFVEQWTTVAFFFTPQAAQEFAKRRGDDHKVYVDSAYRNHEWKLIRSFLLALAATPEPVAVNNIEAAESERDAAIERAKLAEGLCAEKADNYANLVIECDALRNERDLWERAARRTYDEFAAKDARIAVLEGIARLSKYALSDAEANLRMAAMFINGDAVPAAQRKAKAAFDACRAALEGSAK